MKRTEMMAALNAAKNNADAWTRTGNTSTLQVGTLRLRMEHNTNEYTLEDGDTLVKAGGAETPELTRAEAIWYAEAYVKKQTADIEPA